MNVSHKNHYRPNFHFSPSDGWANDPNGLFYLDGVWHLYFQYYPHAPEHGPMHWGHATSCDLMHWEEQPIALFPDASRYIFSGSIVVDSQNTAGFGPAPAAGEGAQDANQGTPPAAALTHQSPPVVAIYTAHDALKAKATGDAALTAQTQAIAYSLDGGTTWTHYTGNPVLPNPGLRDFRDPKVSWDAERGRWLMVLAAGDRVQFYASANLKEWEFLSEFGQKIGAHGGVWECPDFFSMKVEKVHGEPPPPDAEEKWVLFVSLSPGGPNGGSATQYFVGDFDGTKFIPDKQFTTPPNRQKAAAKQIVGNPLNNPTVLETIRSPYAWLDWGRDNYASVLFNNVPDGRRVMIGWMSNWDYAKKLPTAAEGWLGQMTFPRQLILAKTPVSGYVIKSHPPDETSGCFNPTRKIRRSGTLNADGPLAKMGIAPIATLIEPGQIDLTRAVMKIKIRQMSPFGSYLLVFCNEHGERLEILQHNAVPGAPVIVNRRSAGESDFSKKFADPVISAPVVPVEELGLHCSETNFMIILDKTSAEISCNGGERAITTLIFPNWPYTTLLYSSDVEGSAYAIEVEELAV